jgi:hypothetical protein
MSDEQPAKYSVRFKDMGPNEASGAQQLLIAADVPAAVFVVPVQGSVAIRWMGASAADREAVVTDIVDRQDVGEEVRALLRAAGDTRDAMSNGDDD